MHHIHTSKDRSAIEVAVAAFQQRGGQVTKLPKSKRGVSRTQMKEATSDFRRGQEVTDEMLAARADQRLAEVARLKSVCGVL